MRQSTLCALVALLFSPAALADDSVVGRIQMLQPYSPQNLVYVQLVGKPQLNGGACLNNYFVGRMDDANFKTFLYSTLLAAKSSDADIKLIVQGCSGAYPLIVGVEYSPRIP